jgi:lipid-A-disaccharide synthase
MNASSTSGPVIYLVTGEPSGDILGARLMAALKLETEGQITFTGIGGPEMQSEGLKSLFPMSELAVMGLTEVLPRLPGLIRRIRETTRDILQTAPDALITVDSPDFSFRVARRVKGKGFPLIHYVAPTVWAWRSGRAKKISRFLDHLLALLPFEPPYFEKEGLSCSFVGHPVVEGPAKTADGALFRSRHNIGKDETVLVVLPGSRVGEVLRHLPVFEETVSRLSKKQANLRVITVTTNTVAEMVSEITSGWSIPVLVIKNSSEKYEAMAAGDVALAASGTVALELAATGTPSIIAYRVNAVTAWIARKMIRVRYVNLINLILDREAVPERLQDECRADTLCKDLYTLLNTPERAEKQRQDCRQALTVLGGEGSCGPARLAARSVLRVIAQHK